MPIHYRDVMFSNLGGQSLMQWAEFVPLAWNRVNGAPKFWLG